MMKDIDRSRYTVSEDTRQFVNTLKVVGEAYETYMAGMDKLPSFKNSTEAHTNVGMEAFRALRDCLFMSVRHSIENCLQVNGTTEHPDNEI